MGAPSDVRVARVSRFVERYEALPGAVAEVRRGVGEFALGVGVPGPTVERVLLAVSEAATNVVVHAYPRDLDPAGLIQVEATFDGGELAVSVADTGNGLRPQSASPGLGLGLAIIGQLAHAVELLQGRDGGLHVLMRFAIVNA